MAIPSPPESAPVSVVIPCFRCAGTVGRALTSVFTQTTPPAEVIIADDASDDNSAMALRQLAQQDAAASLRIVTLRSNSGPGVARNAGWEAATQPYVAFLDADDAWHPRKIELQLGWMQAHPESLLTAHVISDTSNSGFVADPRIGKALGVTASMLLRSNRFQTSSVMLRRSIPRRFADGKRYCEDYLLWLEIVLGGGKAHFLDAPLAKRFKPVYGGGGASGRLWDMERGELDALRRVWRAGLLGFLAFAAASAWSWLKFLRRIAAARSQ